MSNLFDKSEVGRTLTILVPGGQVTELRALNATGNGDRWPQTFSGYFDDAARLLAVLAEMRTASGIYFVPNPVNPALLARAANRLRKAAKGESTADGDIMRRHWLLIDVDPRRPAGISSSDSEHTAALDKAKEIAAYLALRGWPEPVVADSGNGAHLMYAIDLPVDDGGLIQRCLAALAAHFDDAVVHIDTGVHNPARIWKLYGTLACKGDSTSERPHRMSRILLLPKPLLVVSQEQLTGLAPPERASGTELSDDELAAINGVSLAGSFDIDQFIARNGLQVADPTPYQGGRCWTFEHSPLCEHHGDGPFLIQFASGALAAGCHHNSCQWDWQDLRAKFEPPGTKKNDSPDIAPTKPRKTAEKESFVGVGAKVEPYKSMPVEALPEAIREYICAASAAIGCDPSYIALPLLACLARAIGNRREIRLKRSWTEPAIIWGAVVGKSGTHKTPAIQGATRFLQDHQRDVIAAYGRAMLEYEQQRALYDRDLAAWKRMRPKGPPEPAPYPPEEPVCERYLTTDCTIEALAAILAKQFDGVLVSRDELAGWLGGIAEYKGGKGSDLGHWLASWSAAPLTVDRKTGAIKMLHVPRAAVSIVGGIQPAVLRAAVAREHMQDGLCARLLLVMPDPQPVQWSERTVDESTERSMQRVFERLIMLSPRLDEEGNKVPQPIDLTPEAKTLWVNYYNQHRAELAELDDDLAAAWSKLEAYTARLALIFQLCSWAAGESYASDLEVDEAALRSAITLSNWFGGEARRVYAMFGEADHERDTRELLEWICRRGGAVTSRDLQASLRKYRPAGEAEKALEKLVKAGCGQWHTHHPDQQGGRPTQRFTLSTVPASTKLQETAEIGGFVVSGAGNSEGVPF